MKLAAIHHVAIIVSDYEKSKDFYVNKLGFAIVRENFRKERNDWKLDLRVGEGADAIELEIFAEPNPPKRVNRPEACGLRHLAFRVEDVEATVAELEQMGIGCEPIRLDSYTQKKMTFFFDPDGLLLWTFLNFSWISSFSLAYLRIFQYNSHKSWKNIAYIICK